jgi:hypothetical protein
MTAAEQLVEVRIIGMPLDIYKVVAEHFDELKREFALLRLEENAPDDVPNRLLRVSEQLTSRYSGFSTTPNEVRDEALQRGDKSVDLVYKVPSTVKDASTELEQLLDEADEFCTTGEHLLTLAAPRDVVAFRRWFLEEFARQIDGEQPMSWAQYEASSRT